MRRRRTFWLMMAVLVAIVVAAVAVPIALLAGRSSPERADDVVDRYLTAWQHHDWSAMRRLVQSPPANFAATYQAMEKGLDVTALRVKPGAVTTTGDVASARFHAALTLASIGQYAYDGTLRLSRDGGGHWLITWSPATVHPQLTTDGRFTVTPVTHPRAAILAADGTPLTTEVIDVGVEPRRVKDRAGLLAALQRYAGADPAMVTRALDRPGLRPDEFVPVAQLTVEQYDAVRPQLYPVPGTVFHRSQARRGATPELAAHVVGSVGPITAELLHQLGAPYTATDVVGRRGLERTFERRLAGTPDEVAEIVRAGGTPFVLARKAGVAPQPVHTTIDLGLQQAAEAALAGVNHAALVAVRPSTGAILAVVSTPATEEFDRALDGRYPPGSTFKIVTSAALLASGVTTDQVTTCPPAFTVDGRSFTNFEGESRPTLTFAQAFTISCNTAFIQLGARLSGDQLVASAQWFGFGTTLDLGLAAASGSVPKPAGAVAQAETVIGQGKVVATPLEMTTVAAAVGDGTWRSPVLVTDPPPSRTQSTHALPTAAVAALRSFMLDVVASNDGTGTAARLPGTPVAGKTGTAEFGSGSPPPEHAWFVGYRGDLAFGVLVEGGGVGGRVAAPLAAKFLGASG